MEGSYPGRERKWVEEDLSLRSMFFCKSSKTF
jgi:hypothetical protein